MNEKNHLFSNHALKMLLRLESLMVIVPESTTDEELNNFVRKLGPAGKGMIQNQDQIVRGTCAQPDPIPRPDVDALLSEYGIHQG